MFRAITTAITVPSRLPCTRGVFRRTRRGVRQADTIRDLTAQQITVAALVPGAKVKVGDNISPKYLGGLTGDVASALVRGTRVDILLDKDSTAALRRRDRRERFYMTSGTKRYTLYGVPVSAVTLVLKVLLDGESETRCAR